MASAWRNSALPPEARAWVTASSPPLESMSAKTVQAPSSAKEEGRSSAYAGGGAGDYSDLSLQLAAHRPAHPNSHGGF